jgi:hypothetical protein
MAKEMSRNDPCPCGSGKKFKHCCIHAPTARAARMSKLSIVFLALSIPVGVGVGYLSEDIQNGVLSGVVTILVGFGLQIFRDPPSSRGRGGADRIGFGV